MSKEYFKIYYQSGIVDDWFPYQIPIPRIISMYIKGKPTIEVYIHIINELKMDRRYKAFRIYKVTEELIEEFSC